MVINAMTPSPESEEQFNTWYAEEHVPMLQKVPGWVDSKRFKLVKASGHPPPKYLALHAWRSVDSFGSEEFKSATNTPWRTRIIDAVIQKERELLRYEGRLA